MSPAPFRRAERLAGIEISEIVQLSERAAELRRAGQDVVALTTGEPDFPTPPHVVAAAHAAAEAGQTRYPPTAGTPELRAAIARQAGAEAAEVLVSTGAKQVLANAMLATLDPGDEVLIPAPFWTSYGDIVALAGGRPVRLPCPAADGFKLRPEALAAAITPRTRWLMLNSPSNPTGAVYGPGELAALAAVLADHPQVWVLSDEIYSHLAYVPAPSLRDAAPGLAERTLVVDGVSKAFAMTGWRLGWGIGPRALIGAMAAVQGQVTSGACSISQAAALAALTGPQELLADRRAAFRARRDRVCAALAAIPGISCVPPDGAFYAFPDVTGLILGGGFADDAALCRWLLDEVGLALVPGRAFGMPGHVRLSFAYAEREIDDALDRLATAAARLAARPFQASKEQVTT
ncbi:aspartate aminotransferase [Oceanicola granulosus HTCC2516]|uniref:Aminotransferase n=1 Tax=Oceanicola granulosus (strain ATCC BAA-861 / DSM 15982 / KCTC 12143 / HTCC2516) TaxID=314256 RepID=Q2CGE0_OCEGH|nr:pyridoxal phosphate-dependent aminotransferase [Oceanicola granulosus]EAR51778.1 aspartate aminotransferase [Oceanicola granulosus HTCC2516]